MKTNIILSMLLGFLATHSWCATDDAESAGLTLKSGLPINLKAAGPQSPGRFDFARIRYDEKLQMLVFPDQDFFNKALAILDTYGERFQFDNGNTERFLSMLNQKDRINEAFIDILERNSPLSNAVLEAFLSGGHPPQYVRRILEANLGFDEKIEALYNKTTLPGDIKAVIDRKRNGYIPEEVILDAFERRFTGYHSLRSKVNAQEYKYLIGGGDPTASSNPANGNLLDRTMSSLLNDRREVKIGKGIYLMLPHQNIEVANGDPKILGYIRAHQAIPLNKPLSNEPVNGFPISQAPPIVDPNIVVQPAERQNGCGGTATSDGHDITGRKSYSTTIKGTTYYWKFDDGFVSYKEHPSHQFADKLPNHTVTVTAYDDQGAACGPVGAGHPSGTTGNNGKQCTGYVTLGITSSGRNITATATISGFTGGEYYRWDFGDGASAAGANFPVATHTYQAQGQYTVTVSVNDLNFCTAGAVEIVNVAGSQGGSGPANCCDARDHEHEGGLAPDATHKFNHKLAIEHFFTFTCRLHAEVVSYRAWFLFGIKSWHWSGTTSNVDINGNVFSPNTNDTCATPTVVGLTQSYNGVWNILNIPFGTQVRVQRDSVQSNGGAFNGNTTLTISDCD